MQVGGNNDQLMGEINVTPLVDVMLVLLIIFMVAAPMLVQGINVNLPEASAKALDTRNEKLVVTLTKDRKIFLDAVEVGRDNLVDKIMAVLAQRVDQQVYLRADADVPYGFVVGIMAAIKAAGVPRVGVVTEPLGTYGEKGEPKDGTKEE